MSEMIKDCRWCEHLEKDDGDFNPHCKHCETCGGEKPYFKPYRPTPEQWEADNGTEWTGPVWCHTSSGRRHSATSEWTLYQKYRKNTHYGSEECSAIVCAICPFPPPDDWRPDAAA
jgi:hypothetical protein